MLMDKRSKIFIIIFALVVVIGIALYFGFRSLPGGTDAVISIDGQEYSRIDLTRVKESYDIVIENQYGRNVIHVEPGAISISESDCPDLICVHMGKLSGSGLPLVCMPHHLIISVEGSGIDA